MTPKDSDKTAEILQGGPTTSGSRVHRWRDRRLAPTSETDSTRYKSDLDIATRHPLSGEVFKLRDVALELLDRMKTTS